MSSVIITSLKETSIQYLEESLRRIGTCLDLLSEDEVWLRPNAQLSPVANLILHLSGNIRQYVIASLGNKQDDRQRATEFAATGGYNKAALYNMLAQTINEACATIRKCETAELERTRQVQGFSMTGVAIIIHVTEHLSYHTGQISFRTKQLRETDLNYYGGIDLNVANS